jgi:hypothetical protein
LTEAGEESIPETVTKGPKARVPVEIPICSEFWWKLASYELFPAFKKKTIT